MYDFSIWWAFCYRVGWVVREPIYSIGAPIGHLPWIARAGVMGLDSHDALVRSVDMDEEARGRFLFGIFFGRVPHCLKASADQPTPAS